MGEKKLWTLTSPIGRQFYAESPLKCCRQEVNSRVPLEERVENLISAMSLCFLCGEAKIDCTLAKGTPAEIEVCLTCKNTIISACGVSLPKERPATFKSAGCKFREWGWHDGGPDYKCNHAGRNKGKCCKDSHSDYFDGPCEILNNIA